MTIVCTSVNSCFKNALQDHVVITLLLVTLALDSQSTFKRTHIWMYMHFYPTQVVFSVINKITQLHLSVSIKNILINAHFFPTLLFSGEEVIKMNLQWQIGECVQPCLGLCYLYIIITLIKHFCMLLGNWTSKPAILHPKKHTEQGIKNTPSIKIFCAQIWQVVLNPFTGVGPHWQDKADQEPHLL